MGRERSVFCVSGRYNGKTAYSGVVSISKVWCVSSYDMLQSHYLTFGAYLIYLDRDGLIFTFRPYS